MASPGSSPDAPPLPWGVVPVLESLVQCVQDYAMFVLDSNGYVRSWNSGAERIKGYRREEILGKHFSIFYPDDAIARDWPARELKAAHAEGRFEDEGWRIRKNGERFWANVVFTALPDPSGTIRGFLKITRDLTERRRHEEVLRQSEERFRLLVEGVQDYAIYMLDPGGVVMSWNAGAERIKGYKADEVVGRHYSIFFLPEDLATGKPARQLRIAMEAGSLSEEGWRLRKDGSTFWADVTLTALYDHEDRHRGFAKVTRDLTERKQSEATAQAGRRMTEFLAILSHELRNPLAPIRNAATLLGAGNATERDVRWVGEVVERQTAHLERLVNDLLDLNRVTLGKINLSMAPVDLVTVIDQAVESCRPLLDARGHRLEAAMPVERIWVKGDATRLTQVVLNLLNNAAKYTADGGRVTISLASDEDDAVIRVRDNGIGMTPELAGRVFDMFAQGDRRVERNEGGLGIGLTLARRLVTLQGGSLTAHSEGPGHGSEFVIRLPPMKRADTAPDHVATEATAEPEAGGRILVVDDNKDGAESMAMIVQLWGYGARIAHDGRGALAAVSTYRPHLALLDIGLPGMDGYEVARRIRQMPGIGEKLPLVALTGFGQEDDRQRAKDAGFDRHLVKPVNINLLRGIVTELTQGSLHPEGS